MSEIFLPENNKKVYVGRIKNIKHFYRDMGLLLSLLDIRPVIVKYISQKPSGYQLN